MGPQVWLGRQARSQSPFRRTESGPQVVNGSAVKEEGLGFTGLGSEGSGSWANPADLSNKKCGKAFSLVSLARRKDGF